MSLFENMTSLSKQHAENSGSYTFINPIEPDKPEIDVRIISNVEPAPTVSLYNLLDHSVEQLDYLLTAIESQAMKVEGFKRINPLYTDMHKALQSWAALVQSAKIERIVKDGVVTDKTRDKVIIKWADLSGPTEHERDEFYKIKIGL